MSSTLNWADEISFDLQTEAYSSEATSAEQNTDNQSAMMIVVKSTLIAVGVLGTLSNALVLGGLGLSRRSNMTSSSIHIANHTTLELSPFY